MNSHRWADFYLTDFFDCVKGNQNNMASLTDGSLPLVSARKTDNGYKQFVEPNHKRIFEGNILTLNNDGDGGAGIAYYQPHRMALDSHVTALIPKQNLSRFHLLFVAMCITKQRERFGHGYSINASRIRTFKYMLPVTANGTPDWQFMENYMRQKEQQILKPTIDKLCKQLIYSQIGGGNATSSTTNGKRLILPMFSPTFNVANASKKLTIQKAVFRMCPQRRNPMVSMALLETQAA